MWTRTGWLGVVVWALGVWLVCGLGQRVEAVAQDTEPIRVAAIFSHTGSAAEENTPDYLMPRFAARIINERGGILGRPLELIELDNKSSAIGTVQAAHKAVQMGVVAVVGPSRSSDALAMAPVFEEAGIPMVGTTVTAPSVTRAGEFIFRVCYTDEQQADALVRVAWEELGARRAATINIAGEVYSQGLAERFRRGFISRGGTIVAREEYLQSALDFSDIINSVRQAAPDVVVSPGFARDSGLLLQQARQMGLEMPFMGGDGWTAVEQYPFMKPLTGENYYLSHWHWGKKSPASKGFVRLLKDKMGEDALARVDTGSPCGYDAMMLLADAITRAGTTDPIPLRKALLSTKNYPGVTGTITYNGQRDPQKPLVLLRISGRDVEYVRSIAP